MVVGTKFFFPSLYLSFSELFGGDKQAPASYETKTQII
jgi:hypothetical protein